MPPQHLIAAAAAAPVRCTLSLSLNAVADPAPEIGRRRCNNSTKPLKVDLIILRMRPSKKENPRRLAAGCEISAVGKK